MEAQLPLFFQIKKVCLTLDSNSATTPTTWSYHNVLTIHFKKNVHSFVQLTFSPMAKWEGQKVIWDAYTKNCSAIFFLGKSNFFPHDTAVTAKGIYISKKSGTVNVTRTVRKKPVRCINLIQTRWNKG